MHLLKLLSFVLVFLSCNVLSQDRLFNSSVIPVMKDAQTSLHKVARSLKQPSSDGENYYLIDLDAPFTWQDCIVRRYYEVACFTEDLDCKYPLTCDDNFCKQARYYINPTCPSLNVTARYGCNLCAVTPLNPISNSCKWSQLTRDYVRMYETDGRNPSLILSPLIYTPFIVSCAPSSLLKSLPNNVTGVASFSWSTLSFPRQHYDANVTDKFVLCLANSSKSLGVIFLGEGPFYFTSFPNLDLRSILSYTPMVRRGSKSLGYYIEINKISIKGISIPLPLVKSYSVKLSTAIPYTTLRSDIYKAFVSSFSMATKSIPRIKPVQPFSFCLKSSAVGSVEKGFRVPKIDLETKSGKNWTISGDNSMKRVGNGTACLAFVDGGLKMKDAIVIGTFQMENNFLYLDLVNQKLGFSSSLLARGTSCSSFNFTVINPEYMT